MTFTVIPACPVAHLVPSLPNWSVYHIATSESCYIDVEMSLWVFMLSSADLVLSYLLYDLRGPVDLHVPQRLHPHDHVHARFPGAGEREGTEGTPSAAIVLAGLARGEDGAPLSDHAPVFAVVQR